MERDHVCLSPSHTLFTGHRWGFGQLVGHDEKIGTRGFALEENTFGILHNFLTKHSRENVHQKSHSPLLCGLLREICVLSWKDRRRQVNRLQQCSDGVKFKKKKRSGEAILSNQRVPVATHLISEATLRGSRKPTRSMFFFLSWFWQRQVARKTMIRASPLDIADEGTTPFRATLTSNSHLALRVN